MASRELTTFKDALKAPEKVRRLYVIVPSPKTLLPDFRQFPELEELTLIGGMLHVTEFPNIFDCTKLRRLMFTGSSVARIPSGFSRLKKIEQLVIVGNRALTQLPEDIVELPRLAHLRIDTNALRKLPKHMDRLSGLVELVAYNNQIRQIPPSLYRMPKLRWLELQQNRLARAPVQLMKMKLRHLLTDFEQIRRLSSRS